MKKSEYILYLDMDGVLVDLRGGYEALGRKVDALGVNHDARKDAIWQAYLDDGSQFWAELGWECGGQAVWDTARDLFERVYILSSTGVRNDPTGRGKIVDEGKRMWVKKNLKGMPDENVFIVRGKEFKKAYANKMSILVDDAAVTIEQWNNSGGFGILHDSAHYKNTLETLIEIAAPTSLMEIMKSI
jgi:phosphoglycolate phosphatase-like HAD superfamily hydrolase